jgi:hypothetical protein
MRVSGVRRKRIKMVFSLPLINAVARIHMRRGVENAAIGWNATPTRSEKLQDNFLAHRLLSGTLTTSCYVTVCRIRNGF